MVKRGRARALRWAGVASAGFTEKVGDKLNVVENQAEQDLERFKAFIEDEGYATGAWRGSVDTGTTGTPGVEDAATSRGDSGHAGVSGKAAAAGIGVAAAATAAAVAGKKSGSDEPEVHDVDVLASPPVAPVDADAVPPASAPAGGREGDPLVVRGDADDVRP